MRFGRSTASLLVLLVLLKPAFFGVKAGEWIGMASWGWCSWEMEERLIVMRENS
jgi:hypothetical protein